MAFAAGAGVAFAAGAGATVLAAAGAFCAGVVVTPALAAGASGVWAGLLVVLAAAPQPATTSARPTVAVATIAGRVGRRRGKMWSRGGSPSSARARLLADERIMIGPFVVSADADRGEATRWLLSMR